MAEPADYQKRSWAWFEDKNQALTLALVDDIVRNIDAMDDPEGQHVWQDALVERLLKQIASAANTREEMAALAVKTVEVYALKFARWYA
jgi:hypothetical protein